jgi:uncharacterized membrane protein YkvA (DUF1232 family)
VSQNATAELIRRMVEGFGADLEAIQMGVVDGRTPEQARPLLATALTYVIEPIDLAPDHLEGLGLLDDAAVLRLAAHHAVSCGADDPNLKRLAAEASELVLIFDDLIGPLQDYLNSLHRPNADGKTPSDIISDPELRMGLWRALGKRREDSREDAFVAVAVDANELVKTLRILVRGRLKRAGMVT